MTPEERRRMAVIRKRRQIRHRKKIRRIRLGILGICGLLVLSAFLFFKKGSSSSNASALSQNSSVDNSFTYAKTNSYLDSLQIMEAEDSRIQTILDHPSDYPEPLLKILTNNIETLDFVLEYPKKKDLPPADAIGDLTEGEIPLLLQWDERWGYSNYGESIIAVSGCGPTCIAMVASGLTGQNDITPSAVARYSTENGFLTEEFDTKWNLMTYGCEQFGITGTELGLDETAMANALNSGYPIICSVGPGDFTANGHFIVLTGYQDGQFQVHDPNSQIRSEKLWSFDTLKGQILNMWYYQLCSWYPGA